MSRNTIDLGIDLGTTNSAIALLQGTEVEILKNNEGNEFTPSAVWLDARGRTWVGKRAKEHLEDDPDNAVCEFKLQMGTTETKKFLRNGATMSPEELSAEVLKALRATLKQRTDEELDAAVITVPAAFELPQCEATKRAAELAGIRQVALIQEPCAAGLAYGFQSGDEKTFWLVYDYGGGTFDAAIISAKDGHLKVVNSGGDNHLGGKLIDWAIVDELLIPAVTRQYRLPDFRRGNQKWRAAIAKLKMKAEEAKIVVSQNESIDIIIDYLCTDADGEQVRFEYELKKRDVERLAEPFILRSINICKKVLAGANLQAGNIEKVILVGGPTAMPYLRQRLADKVEGLGIPLEVRMDPLTVVARGAAIFAGTQIINDIESRPIVEGQFAVELDYQPMGADTEPLVGGKLVATHVKDFSGYTIEFVNTAARPPWRSGTLGLGPEGIFVTNLWAEKGRPNLYAIEVCDPAGRQVITTPDSLRYTVGMVLSDQTLIHSVGVAQADNSMLWFFEKGAPLPLRRREVFKSVAEVHQGVTGEAIHIPVMEGTNERAERNRQIGTLEVDAAAIRRSIPAGSEVEVTLDIDESRLVTVRAYFPILDEEYEGVLKMGYEQIDMGAIKSSFASEKERLSNLRQKAAETGDQAALDALGKIDQEMMLHEVEGSIEAAAADPDARQKARNRLNDLKTALDESEEAVRWPSLVADAESLIKLTKEILQEHGDRSDIQTAENLESEIRKAIQARDADLLERRLSEMRMQLRQVLDRKDIMPVINFRGLCNQRGEMSNQGQAAQLISQGDDAIRNNNIGALREVNRQLIDLLPHNADTDFDPRRLIKS